MFSSPSLPELILSAATPASLSAATWSCISATSGDTTTVRPSPTSAGTWKHSDLPEPVGITASALRPDSSVSITASWPGRNTSNPKTSRSTVLAAAIAVSPAWAPCVGRRADSTCAPSDLSADALCGTDAGGRLGRSVNGPPRRRPAPSASPVPARLPASDIFAVLPDDRRQSPATTEAAVTPGMLRRAVHRDSVSRVAIFPRTRRP